VSNTRIVEGQSFTLEVRSEDGDIQSVSQESLAGFQIVSGPSTSRSVQIINGVVTSTSSYSWTLLPKRRGRQTIPEISVKVGGKLFRTAPVNIDVIAASQATDPGNQNKGTSLYLVAEVDPTDAYRGEQITVTWTLYTQLNISGWEIVSQPNLTGFWTEELFAPNKLQLRERVVQGRRYYTAVVRRLALFPTQSGTLEIDPLVLKIGVQVRNRRRIDPFFDDFSLFNPGRVEHRVVASKAVQIDATPIPLERRPPDYSGLVGRFNISGHLERGEVMQDEAVAFTLTISGEGIFKAIDAPAIAFPQGLEVFDPKISREPALGDIVGGSKVIEYVIIPRQADTFTIPKVRLPYFNPTQEQYEVQTVGPFTLQAIPREDALSATSGYTRQEVALLGKDIRFVKQGRPRWLKTGKKDWYTPALLLLNLATILLFAAPAAGARFQTLAVMVQPGWRARRALRSAIALLEEIHDKQVDIYEGISQALTLYLNYRLGRETREYTMAGVDEILRDQGITEISRIVLSQILERASAARFASVDGGTAEADRRAFLDILRTIDTEWPA
jgi:hypothetical protein